MTSDEYESAADRADHRRQEIEELMSEISNNRCGKCGSLLAHYRLHGVRCTNLTCPGPFGGGPYRKTPRGAGHDQSTETSAADHSSAVD